MGENARIDPAAFERLQEDVRAYLDAREVFVQTSSPAPSGLPTVGPVRHTERVARAVRAEHVHPRAPARAAQFRAGFTVLHAPTFKPIPPATELAAEPSW